uniref:Sperm flagellar 1 n=1 Tax=Cyprinodon variegatus TaxID=28743 RepID=A0A3Q2CD66_CYPVA
MSVFDCYICGLFHAVMIAEIIQHFFPKFVDLHNYSSCCKIQQKLSNWSLLNKRVFPKLDIYVPEETVKKIVVSTPGVIIPVLNILKKKIEEKREQTTNNSPQYFYTGSQEKPLSDLEIQRAEARIVAQLEEIKIPESKLYGKTITSTGPNKICFTACNSFWNILIFNLCSYHTEKRRM